jgi:hypothetical protein
LDVDAGWPGKCPKCGRNDAVRHEKGHQLAAVATLVVFALLVVFCFAAAVALEQL